VRLLAAIKPYAPPVTEFVLAGATMDDVRQGQRDNAERATARAAEQIAAQGWRVDTVVVEGDPRTAIVEAADDWNADLIVMGSHGHSALQRLLMGSVAQAVVAHAHCSVEVVRRRDA
jgi:nucleotide-binding universal stress UspA family protein